uniref:hypothetical protein n=1 Tax=Salmonella sp. TaxID=599 RepID=UPI001CDA0EC7|nr:hypothetical protein [Salmonella sp.]
MGIIHKRHWWTFAGGGIHLLAPSVGTQFIGKPTLRFAYTAYLTDKAITKQVIQPKDTLSRLSQGWQQFEVYRQQGLGELLQPLLCLRCQRGSNFAKRNASPK